MSQENQRASELNHSEKVPAAADTAVVLQAGKKPLDFPTPAVAAHGRPS